VICIDLSKPKRKGQREECCQTVVLGAPQYRLDGQVKVTRSH